MSKSSIISVVFKEQMAYSLDKCFTSAWRRGAGRLRFEMIRGKVAWLMSLHLYSIYTAVVNVKKTYVCMYYTLYLISPWQCLSGVHTAVPRFISRCTSLGVFPAVSCSTLFWFSGVFSPPFSFFSSPLLWEQRTQVNLILPCQSGRICGLYFTHFP